MVRARARLLLMAAVLSGVTSIGIAQNPSLDYPQWRGRTRDGAASAFAEPKSWPDALTQRWKIQVGEGYATPLVIGGTVYIFSRRGEREVMTALDAMSGAERWRSDYPAEYAPSQAIAAHGAGPKATPLFHEAKLFTLGISGIVSAFDATTGKLVWQTTPPKEPPYFSAASSPLGEEGIVLTHPGNYGPLTAFDSNTGEVKWTAGGNGGFIVSPIATTLGGTRQIITATQDSVIGVSLEGDVLWRSLWDGSGGSTTPVLYNDTIIVSALDKGVAAIRPMLRGGTWTTDTVWHTKEVSMYISNPVVVEDTVFGLSRRNRGQFFALDAKSGGLLWLGQPREADNTAFVKAGNLIFMLNDDAELIVAKASRSAFEPIVRYTVADSATWAQPTLSGSRLFVKDVSSLSLWTLD